MVNGALMPVKTMQVFRANKETILDLSLYLFNIDVTCRY